MEVASDPYVNARSARRFGMPYGLSQSTNYPSGGANASPYATAGGRSPMRQRLPILPDLSEHPNVSPAGSGSSSGFTAQNQEEGQRQQEQLREQQQRTSEALSAEKQQQNVIAQRKQAVSIADYRQKRDTSPGATAAREQTQEAKSLGIDPSSSPTDIAAAASGPVHQGADGRMAGGDTGNESVSPTQPNDVRNAVLQIQAQKDGQQRMAVDQSYAKGAGVTSPFSPATTPAPSTTAPATLRDGTSASTPPPSPVAAPVAPTPFAPVVKPRKPRPGFAGSDSNDPNATTS